MIWSLVALLLFVTGAVRSQALRDDRTWGDEDYVIAGTLGLHEKNPFPRTFTHSEIYSPSLGKGLDFILLQTPYPPLQHVVVYAARNAPNPIFAVRSVFWVLGLGVPVVVFLAARMVSSEWSALLPTTLAAVAPALTLTSQQVKWYALAPLLATTAGVLLWRCCRSVKAWCWIAYAGCTILLLQVHYFAGFVLPAHAVYVLMTTPKAWKRFSLTWAAIGVLTVPWYMFALPSQLIYLKGDFQAMRVASDEQWSRPVSTRDIASWQAYDGLMCLGALPSQLRVRFLLPVLLAGVWLIWVASHAREAGRRDLARVGPVVMAVALVGQTLSACYVGNMTPLSWTYLVTWVPLVSLTLGIGILELRRRYKLAMAGTFIGLSLWSLHENRFPSQIDETASLSTYTKVVALLVREESFDTGVAYRDETDARKMNVFLKSPVLQFVGWPSPTEPRSSRIDRMFWVTPRGTGIPPSSDPAWSVPRLFASFDRTAVFTSCRPPRAKC